MKYKTAYEGMELLDAILADDKCQTQECSTRFIELDFDDNWGIEVTWKEDKKTLETVSDFVQFVYEVANTDQESPALTVKEAKKVVDNIPIEAWLDDAYNTALDHVLKLKYATQRITIKGKQTMVHLILADVFVDLKKGE